MSIRFEKDLLHNYVEIELQYFLRPFNVMQSLFFQSKYRIVDNFILPNTLFKNIMSFVVSVLCALSFIYTIISVWQNTHATSFHALVTSVYLSYNIYGILIGSVLIIWLSDRNIEFVLKIQDLIKILEFNKCFLIEYAFINSIIMAAIFILNFLLYGYFVVHLQKFALGLTFSAIVCILNQDLDIIYVIIFANILKKCASRWTVEARQKNNFNDQGKWVKLFNAFLNLTESYQLYQKIFEFYELLRRVGIVFLGLQLTVCRVCSNDIKSIQCTVMLHAFQLICVWIVKKFITLSILSFEMEIFYEKLREIETVCIILVSSDNPSERELKIWKNIIRVSSCSVRKTTACGLCEVGAALPQWLLQATTAYTIVLLQFHITTFSRATNDIYDLD
uniref:Gustatory receptor 61 n=1 Tax=Bombyx mori TaxID=7091 RepID=B7FF46_BOMMO|nr:TPA_inf: gustatory receptor 61 [Bombyx mori]